MVNSDSGELHVVDGPHRTEVDRLSPATVARAFDATRLTQARALAGFTKRRLADLLAVTPAAVSQYEMGTNRPRPELIQRLADVLNVPSAFFIAGRPHGRLDPSVAHFRSLRSTRAYQRAKAIAFAEQVWELTFSLEKRVQLPLVDLPGFAGGEVHAGEELPTDPVGAARMLRATWKLGKGPITHLVRRIEAHGIVVFAPRRDDDLRSVDAFSTSRLPRPLMVLTTNKADDVYRHRFTAAHELGHLVMHSDATPGDAAQEREADVFAAEFLTPRDSILPELPARTDLNRLSQLRDKWGVSVDSLLYRCREVGLMSDSSASRAYQRLHTLRDQPGFAPEPIGAYSGEVPALLTQAFRLATAEGLSIVDLARELAWTVPYTRRMLDTDEKRPVLKLVAD
jgi:Zn-dependent peptidase ImmA (M78 family)/transcriptional regulator with XRE-family HTH domain